MTHHFSQPQVLFNIRPMRSEEAEDCLALIHLSIRALSTQAYSPDLIEKIVGLYENSSSLSGTIVVAECNSQIVGVACAKKVLGITWNINAVFTHPDFIHNGIGRRLVEFLEEAAVDNDMKIMTVVSSLTAVGFYKALDYEYGGETKINETIPCAFFSKRLQPLTLVDNLRQGCMSGLVIVILIIILL